MVVWRFKIRIKENVTMALSDQEVFEKVKAVIVKQLGVSQDEVTMEASFTDDLGADSLDTVELVLALEDEFSPLEISDDEAEKLVTVGKTVEYIQKNLK
jgi:acyl carrier protein